MSTKKFKGPKRKRVDWMELDEERERWLARGEPICDFEGEFSTAFDSMGHAKALWEANRERLMKKEFRYIWFNIDGIREQIGWRPWAWWRFEGPKEPRKRVFVGFPSRLNVQEWQRTREPDLLYLHRLGMLEPEELEKFDALGEHERAWYGYYELPTDAPITEVNPEEEEALAF